MNKIVYIDPNSPYQNALDRINAAPPKPPYVEPPKTARKHGSIDLAWARRHLRSFAHSQDAVRRARAHAAETRRNAERNAQ